MEDFENMAGMENPETEGDIGTQVNNCCEDCARLESRVTVAERDIEWMQTHKAEDGTVRVIQTKVEANSNAITGKADKTTTDFLLAEVENLKLNKAGRAELDAKADTSAVNALLADKADKAELARKAEKSYVDAQLATKADRTEIAAKADSSYVDEQLATKAGKAELAAKADQGYVDAQLASKADGSYVDEQLAAKADKSALDRVETVLAGKADAADVQGQIDAAMERMYPVGSIYLSMSGQSPAERFGFGIWQRIANGRVLVGVDEADNDFNGTNKTGGHKELQSHDHVVPSIDTNFPGAHDHQMGLRFTELRFTVGGTNSMFAGQYGNTTTSYSGNHAHTVPQNITQVAGGGNAQNLQPYLTCYIWERTA